VVDACLPFVLFAFLGFLVRHFHAVVGLGEAGLLHSGTVLDSILASAPCTHGGAASLVTAVVGAFDTELTVPVGAIGEDDTFTVLVPGLGAGTLLKGRASLAVEIGFGDDGLDVLHYHFTVLVLPAGNPLFVAGLKEAVNRAGLCVLALASLDHEGQLVVFAGLQPSRLGTGNKTRVEVQVGLMPGAVPFLGTFVTA